MKRRRWFREPQYEALKDRAAEQSLAALTYKYSSLALDRQLAVVREDVKELFGVFDEMGRACPVCGERSPYIRRHYEGFACRRLKDALDL